MIPFQPNSFCAALARPIRGWLAPALLLFVLAACGGEAQPTPAAPPPIPVETGGMALPSAGADSAAPAVADAAPAVDALPPSPATEQPIFAVGAQIATTAPAVLYAEADPTSLRLAEYAAGSVLTVIEPDGDYEAYPVEVEGQRWYRVRAEDRLVGWVVEEAASVE